MQKIALISCSSQKANKPGRAREVYTSDLFTKAMQYAKRHGLTPIILSAKHGPILPDTRIYPYNEALTGKTIQERRGWASRAEAALRCLLNRQSCTPGKEYDGIEFTFLAGEKYVDPLSSMLAAKGGGVRLPLKGKALGFRKRFLLGLDS